MAAANAEATNSAWANVAHDQAENEAARLAQADLQISTLERTKEPWDDSTIDTYLSAGRTVDDLLKLHQGGTASEQLLRVSDRWVRLSNGPAKRGLALQDQRKKREQADQQRREQVARQNALPACVSCCLRHRFGATNEACNAVCTSDLRSYMSRDLQVCCPEATLEDAFKHGGCR